MTLLAHSNQTAGARPVSRIIELRQLLAAKFPTATKAASTHQGPGFTSIAEWLSDGLPEASVTEVVCPVPSGGSATALHALISSAQSHGRRLALVDAADCFDPAGLSERELDALLWVRCASAEQAFKATDLLLRDGNLSLVVLDLLLRPERSLRAVAATYWYRLQRVVEDSGATLVVISPAPLVASAACRVRLPQRLGLRAMNLLHEQVVARVELETERFRSATARDYVASTPAYAVG